MTALVPEAGAVSPADHAAAPSAEPLLLAPEPDGHGNPAQVAGTRDLLLAVARLTMAGLSASGWSVGSSGKGVRRAAYGR
ncbi:hypothetical protein [Streptomyces pratensis]|uniref:hypothetical protein n=1 Tax=Streptomyces pratensis TaxID=1169025 RepID=UPI0019322266|nr:hypothetical protein [Streptomyces pratensis]